MSKKLTICVTRCEEEWKTCSSLFESIALQKGIDFEDIEVIVSNDGIHAIPDKAYERFPYKVNTITHERVGVSANRNIALDNATGEYVMFCDADDCFLNMYALHEILNEASLGYEMITSCFIEEQPDREKGGWTIFRHDKDITFIHGKVYNRQFLIDNDLRFDEELTMHEDGYFNVLCDTIADKKKFITVPLYLWVWNEKSVIRQYDKDTFLFKTYPQLMKVREKMAEQLELRGYIDEYINNVLNTVANSYYDFQKPVALNPENAELIAEAEKAFKAFYEKFGNVYRECNINTLSHSLMCARLNAFNNGLRVEQQTIREWLTHITKEVK